MEKPVSSLEALTDSSVVNYCYQASVTVKWVIGAHVYATKSIKRATNIYIDVNETRAKFAVDLIKVSFF